MKTKIVYLIRHAQSEFQANNEYFEAHLGGSLNHVGLSDKGIMQANALNKRFIDYGYIFDAVYSSPAERAKKTAYVACSGIYSLENIAIMSEFQEIHHGTSEGKLLEDINPELLQHKDRTLEFKFPGGESLREVEERMIGGLYGILKSAYENNYSRIAVFSHSRAIKCALHRILEFKIPSNFYIKNTSITELEYDYDGKSWCVIRIGDAQHLENLQRSQ